MHLYPIVDLFTLFPITKSFNQYSKLLHKHYYYINKTGFKSLTSAHTTIIVNLMAASLGILLSPYDLTIDFFVARPFQMEL